MLIIILKYLKLLFWKLHWNNHLISPLVLSWLLFCCSLFPYQTFPGCSTVSWPKTLFSTPIFHPEICFKFSFLSLHFSICIFILPFPQLTSESPCLWVLLTAVGACYYNDYKVNLLSLGHSCIKSCKIRNISPYCRDPKSFQGPDLQQVQTHRQYKIKTDVTLTAVEPHCSDLQNKKNLICFQSLLKNAVIAYS